MHQLYIGGLAPRQGTLLTLNYTTESHWPVVQDRIKGGEKGVGVEREKGERKSKRGVGDKRRREERRKGKNKESRLGFPQPLGT